MADTRDRHAPDSPPRAASPGRTPVLIIGAGAAGLRTAIELASTGIDTLVLGRRAHGDAHTRMAAGGINATLGSLDPEDRWEIHAADTIREGGYLCEPRAVELLAREAPARVLELDAWGCRFDRTDGGAINQRYFGAQSFRRTCFVGDTTGEAILTTLVEKADSLGIPFQENVLITRILVRGGAVAGALGVALTTGEPLHFPAVTIVLAAGGCTSIYERGSSRSDENTGDAVALAYDAGAELRDMEMVQFHPTGMIAPAGMRGRLVTEAVRGEGGRLFNARGERFMSRYAPEQMELAARDIVARANYREIRDGLGTRGGGVLLDISHQDPALVRDRLPKIHAQLLEQGIDITRQPVEVAPTAHYPMGGVRVDPDTGATGVPGLYAVGEAASGVHGANRLGGNSLAETVVFGQRAGAHIGRRLQDPNTAAHRQVDPAIPDAEAWDAHRSRLDALQRARGAHDPEEVMARLRRLMWQRAGIIRSGDDVRDGLAGLATLARQARDLDVAGSTAGDGALARALSLPFALLAAEAVLRGALLREESRGAHFREDAPDTREDWCRSILSVRGPDGSMRLRTEAVPPIPAPVQRALDEHHSLDYHHLE
jgi:succinate dehydrogenase / fumarate reductase, flavoprotein subunit